MNEPLGNPGCHLYSESPTSCGAFIIHSQSMLTVEERIRDAETRIFKAVFPNTTNHYDTLFGGTAMQLMDEVAFITATRFARKRVVTVSSDKINFTKPIPAGTIIELVGRVAHIGNTSLKIAVEIYVEEMYSLHREQAIHGEFTFVAIDEEKKPVKIL
jgi:acyl-CoA hydrolase